MWFYLVTGCLIEFFAFRDVLAAYNNSHVVDVLEEIASIKSPRVIDAMIHVDRGHFTAHNDSRKYMLAARDIGYGCIIDNPVQHAEVLELLQDKLVPGAKVLDVGSGSGYLTTCFAHMVGKEGSVVGIEHIPEIVTHSSNATTLHYPKLNKRIKFVCGDGRLGYPEGGPYDVIHVGASSETVPKAYIEQLKNNSKMYINVRNRTLKGKVFVIMKRQDGTLRKKFITFQRPFNNLTARFTQLLMFRDRYYRTYHQYMWPYKIPYEEDEKGLSFEFPKLNLTYDEHSSDHTHWVAPPWWSGIQDNIERERLFGPSTIPPENTDFSYVASSLENYGK